MLTSLLTPDPLVLLSAPATNIVSFLLVFVLAIILIVAGFSLISAVVEFALYAGGAAVLIGAVFYFSDALSFSAGWQYISDMLALSLLAF